MPMKRQKRNAVKSKQPSYVGCKSIQVWERRCDDSTCSRMRSVSLHMHQLKGRFREQARSHILISIAWDGVLT